MCRMAVCARLAVIPAMLVRWAGEPTHGRQLTGSSVAGAPAPPDAHTVGAAADLALPLRSGDVLGNADDGGANGSKGADAIRTSTRVACCDC